MNKKLPLILVILIIIFSILSIQLGSIFIPLNKLFPIEFIPNHIKMIVYEIRLPRIIMAILIGMMLGSSGVVVQSVFQNPIADPYIIGISASATFGAVIAYILKLPDIMYGISSFFSCVCSSFLIFKFSNKNGKMNVTTLLIVGIAISSFIGAFTSFAMYLIGEDSFKITMWLMGYLGSATWKKIFLLLPPLIFSLVFFYLHRLELDSLLCGDDEATSLGVNVHRLKIKMLVTSSLIVAFSVAFSGMIGFVGLIIPHCIRMIIGPSNSKLLPNSALAGGLFLLICDTLGRTVLTPVEVPIGVVTAFFGAPFFLYLAFKRRGF